MKNLIFKFKKWRTFRKIKKYCIPEESLNFNDGRNKVELKLNMFTGEYEFHHCMFTQTLGGLYFESEEVIIKMLQELKAEDHTLIFADKELEGRK